MENIDFNALRDRAYKCACEHGFHNKELSSAHCLMWVITDLSKAVEADRKRQYCTKEGLFTPNKDAFENRRKDDDFDFKTDFEELIKDSVEDNLADTVIRLLDLAGMKKYSLSDPRNWINIVDKDYSFAENCCCIIFGIFEVDSCNVAIKRTLSYLFNLAESLNIDLLWHVEQKMTYNELRPYKNEKKY